MSDNNLFYAPWICVDTYERVNKSNDSMANWVNKNNPFRNIPKNNGFQSLGTRLLLEQDDQNRVPIAESQASSSLSLEMEEYEEQDGSGSPQRKFPRKDNEAKEATVLASTLSMCNYVHNF